MDDVAEQHIKWVDLRRFGAALKVVPNSPLRGIPMTCLDVFDEQMFTDALREAFRGPAGGDGEMPGVGGTGWQQAWWSEMDALGFSRAAQRYEVRDANGQRSFRLYSERAAFTLADMQRAVPGLLADDMRELPLAEVVHQSEVSADMAQQWKTFAEDVLAKEAVDVWVPKANPFDVPFKEARPIKDVLSALGKLERNMVLDGSPTTQWFAASLDRANYRENALTVFYADLDAAVAAGQKADEMQKVSLPYALPMWVGRDGRVIALRDIRHAPEALQLTPISVVGAVGPEGLVVGLLRAIPKVSKVYAEELVKWRAWNAGGEALASGDLFASFKRLVEADAALCDRFSAADSAALRWLVDGNIARISGAPAAVKPYSDWTQENLQQLALRASCYLPAVTAGETLVLLSVIDARARALDVQAAKDVAKAALRRVAETVRVRDDVDTTPDVAKVRHEDTGEKIGGARKDYSRRAMIRDDLESMNELERKSLVVKKNVWPSLDYAGMREAGVTPQAAVAIKYLKDTLATEPDRRRNVDDPEGDYIEAIGRVRDAMADVKTLDEFASVCLKLYQLGRGDTNYISGGSPFQIQVGRKVCDLLADSFRDLGYGDSARREPYVASRISYEVRRKVREGAEWKSLIKSKRDKSDEEKEADTELSQQQRELHRPHLESVRRIGGEDWRNGRDIVAQDLVDHFGYRAVEFGNWLPQDERQTVLNMAFASLCDLASALNLPPRAISFDGKLAVAFGSRGRGGRNAALAHFEPARNVINLTRMEGAGSLAHEWLHGLDWHLGGGEKFLTGSGRPRFTDDPMRALVSALVEKPTTMAELEAHAKAEAEKGKRYTESWFSAQSSESRVAISKVFGEMFERAHGVMLDAAIKRLETIRGTPGAVLGFEGAVEYGIRSDLDEQIVDGLRSACESRKGFTKVRKNIEGNVSWMLGHMAVWATVEAAREIGFELGEGFLGRSRAVPTEFKKQALALDETRSSPYWATDLEMFARAGAQYIYYELEAKGIRSDYLVYGADEERYVNHPLGNPNPDREDRLMLAEHFSALIGDYRVRLLRTMESDCDVEP